MSDYKSMYFNLLAGTANAIDLLIKTQREGEEAYMEKEEEATAAKESARLSKIAGPEKIKRCN